MRSRITPSDFITLFITVMLRYLASFLWFGLRNPKDFYIEIASLLVIYFFEELRLIFCYILFVLLCLLRRVVHISIRGMITALFGGIKYTFWNRKRHLICNIYDRVIDIAYQMTFVDNVINIKAINKNIAHLMSVIILYDNFFARLSVSVFKAC